MTSFNLQIALLGLTVRNVQSAAVATVRNRINRVNPLATTFMGNVPTVVRVAGMADIVLVSLVCRKAESNNHHCFLKEK